jgi:uncharacterized C2H2 Zn-finger protein
MNILESIAAGEVYKNTSVEKHYETADDTCFVCPHCGVVWERPRKDKRKVYFSHGVVPSYGKKRKVCPFCR